MELSSKQLQAALAQLAELDDVSLWQAARSTMPEHRRERLEELHFKQQREGLTSTEQEEEQSLLALYRQTLLVRGKSAALLYERGYLLSELAERELPGEKRPPITSQDNGELVALVERIKARPPDPASIVPAKGDLAAVLLALISAEPDGDSDLDEELAALDLAEEELRAKARLDDIAEGRG